MLYHKVHSTTLQDLYLVLVSLIKIQMSEHTYWCPTMEQYLFLLQSEGLSSLLFEREVMGDLVGIHNGRQPPPHHFSSVIC
jgi:hypothetical protein